MANRYGTIDKFGRGTEDRGHGFRKGLPGIGFRLTPDGNYDMEKKNLRNVGDPIQDSDATTRGYVINTIVTILADSVAKLTDFFNNKCSILTSKVQEVEQSLGVAQRVNVSQSEQIARLIVRLQDLEDAFVEIRDANLNQSKQIATLVGEVTKKNSRDPGGDLAVFVTKNILSKTG